jgi:aquaporin Z
VCVNELATPADASGASPMTRHQLGVFGVALGQGLILAALLALTAPITGGFLNPAITLMLWVFGRIETRMAGGLIFVQLLGSVLAAVCLYFTFHDGVLRVAQFGAPHVNPLAYHDGGQRALYAAVVLELVLTFFLVFAIFGLAGKDALHLGLVAGMIATVCALLGFALTGAALNPARWLGPTLLDFLTSTGSRNPWADSLAYLAGPIVGALAGGYFVFKAYPTDDGKK